MRRWQPISTVPLDTPVIVTNGRSRRMAILRTQKPVWDFEPEAQSHAYANALGSLVQSPAQFVPTHWFALPKLPGAGS
jgi:hypothetical protein